MGNIKLDKNYNFIEEKGLYNDDFIEAVELISQAHSNNVITDTDASFLLKIVLKKEFAKETKSVIPSTKQAPEIHSFFMNMKSKQIKHA